MKQGVESLSTDQDRRRRDFFVLFFIFIFFCGPCFRQKRQLTVNPESCRRECLVGWGILRITRFLEIFWFVTIDSVDVCGPKNEFLIVSSMASSGSLKRPIFLKENYNPLSFALFTQESQYESFVCVKNKTGCREREKCKEQEGKITKKGKNSLGVGW